MSIKTGNDFFVLPPNGHKYSYTSGQSPAAADQLSPPWARATQLVQWYRGGGPTNLKVATGQHLIGVLRQPWNTFNRRVGRSSGLVVNFLLIGLHLLLTSIRVTSWGSMLSTMQTLLTGQQAGHVMQTDKTA